MHIVFVIFLAALTGVDGGDALLTGSRPGREGAARESPINLADVRVDLSLKDGDAIVGMPENEACDAEKKIAGTDSLGELPMGEGRPNEECLRGKTYTNAIMVIGQVRPGKGRAADAGVTFSWTRKVCAAGWDVEPDHQSGQMVARVNARYQAVGLNPGGGIPRANPGGGMPDLNTMVLDTGDDAYNDPTPSATGKIYIYDNPGVNLALYKTVSVAGFLVEKREFVYQVWANGDGQPPKLAGEIVLLQTAIAKKIDTEGDYANRYQPICNTVAVIPRLAPLVVSDEDFDKMK